MRIVRRNVDLLGQTLDASKQPDGHARESLFAHCPMDVNTRFIGDWRGTDYIGITGPADWSQAQTYGSMWRGWTQREGAKLPAGIGWRHHEPVAEIIRQGIAQAPEAHRQKIRDLVEGILKKTDRIVGGETLPLYVEGSWETTGAETIRDQPEVLAAIEKIFASYSGLTAKLALLSLALGNAEREAGFYKGSAPIKKRVYWDDGAAVDFDLDNLPSLTELSRHELRRKLEAAADTQRPGAHYCFVYGLTPPVVRRIVSKDDWMTNLVGGF